MLISSYDSAMPVTRLLNFPCATSSTVNFSFAIGASQRFANHCPHADTATPTTRKPSMNISIPCKKKLVRMMTSVPKENDHNSAENLNCKDEFVIAEPLFFQYIDQYPGGSRNRIGGAGFFLRVEHDAIHFGHGFNPARPGLAPHRKIAGYVFAGVEIRRDVGEHPIEPAILGHVFHVGKTFLAVLDFVP